MQTAACARPFPIALVLAALHYVEQGRFSIDEDINAKLRSWKVLTTSRTSPLRLAFTYVPNA
jgi:hypothetical protein